MLETRMSPVSTPPRSVSRATALRPARPALSSVRESAAHALPSARPVERRTGRSRMPRSEARLLAFAIAGTALMCAVLVVYLAAYAHVSQLGLEQTRARAQLRQARQENELLQAKRALLQSPARIIAAAQKLGMTTGAQRVTYINARAAAARTADGGSGDGQNFQGAIGGTSADGDAAAAFHH